MDKNILDLVITSGVKFVDNVEVMEQLGNSITHE